MLLSRTKIVIDDCIIQYASYQNDDKESPCYVWLHGWGRDLTDWIPLIDIHHRNYPSDNHIAIDLPLFGGSSTPSRAYSIHEYADTVEQCIKKKVPNYNKRPIVIVGHSFGGRITLVLASRNAFSSMSIMLVNHAGIEYPKPWNVRVKIAINKLLKPFRALVRPFLSRDGVGIQHNRMRQIFYKTVQTDLKYCADSITCPTTLLWGNKDTVLPLWHYKTWRKLIPHAYARIVWEQAHSPHCSAPQDVFACYQNSRNIL